MDNYICFYSDNVLNKIIKHNDTNETFFFDENKGVEFTKGRRLFISEIFIFDSSLNDRMKTLIKREINAGADLWIGAPDCLRNEIFSFFQKDDDSVIFDLVESSGIEFFKSWFTRAANKLLDIALGDDVGLKAFTIKINRGWLKDMENVIKKLKQKEGEYNPFLNTNDFTYSIIREMVRTGSQRSLRTLVEKYKPRGKNIGQFIAEVKSYYYFGGPFDELGLKKSDWPIEIDISNSKEPIAILNNRDRLYEIFNKLGENLPPYEYTLIDRESGHKSSIDYGKLDSYSTSRDMLTKLSVPIKLFFSNIPLDTAERDVVIVQDIVDTKNTQVFSLIGSFWEIIISVDIGTKDKDYASNRNHVIKAFEQAKIRSQDHKFITKERFFSILISRDFTESARNMAGLFDSPRVVLLKLSEFVRINQYINSLSTDGRIFAAWSLFLLGDIASPNSEGLINQYIEMVNDELNQRGLK